MQLDSICIKYTKSHNEIMRSLEGAKRRLVLFAASAWWYDSADVLSLVCTGKARDCHIAQEAH